MTFFTDLMTMTLIGHDLTVVTSQAFDSFDSQLFS